MPKHVHVPEYLRVIEGGRTPRRKGFAKAALLSGGIAAAGVSAGLLNFRAHGDEGGELLVGRGGALVIRNNQAERLMTLSQRMERLSNRELIAKMLHEGEEPVFQRGLEHNMATLVLETRKERAVTDMADALLHDESPMVRASLAYSLGRMRLHAALPALREAAGRDRSAAVRTAAEESIASIEGKGR